MTREEARLTLQENLGYLTSIHHQRILDAIKVAIEVLSESSLPSNLDEAAEKYAIQGHENHTNINYINTYIEGKRIGFIAGAEWMAGQGVSMEYEVEDKCLELGYGSLPGLDPIINLQNSFHVGDKVILQVRKK